MTVAVEDNPAEERFEVSKDGVLAGFTTYRRTKGRVAFLHTEIDQRFEGQGLGSQLIQAALDHAREHQLAVLPFCPFVLGYIQRHPDYAEIVPAGDRERFGLS